MSKIRHLFWDFDGTLYDTYPQLVRAFSRGLDSLGLGDLLDGESLLKLLKGSVYRGAQWCAEKSGADVDDIMKGYRYYHDFENIFPAYEGMEKCLRRLHEAGFHHYLYTHRNHTAVDQLERDGLWELFEDAVLRTDGFPDKPAPDALLALMERNGLKPEECAMVGDRDIDIDAGHNAGMSGVMFDPDGFYADHPVEISARTMDELCRKLME